MALRQIRIQPDDILNKKSRPVEKVDDKIKELVADMLETMYASEGVGLAAVQVGVLRRVLVIDMSEDGTEPIVMINPEVLEESGMQKEREACLSVPKLSGDVERPARIVIKALNELGEEFTMECEEFLAVAVSHELDHLNGILYDEKALQMYEEDEEEIKRRKKERKLQFKKKKKEKMAGR